MNINIKEQVVVLFPPSPKGYYVDYLYQELLSENYKVFQQVKGYNNPIFRIMRKLLLKNNRHGYFLLEEWKKIDYKEIELVIMYDNKYRKRIVSELRKVYRGRIAVYIIDPLCKAINFWDDYEVLKDDVTFFSTDYEDCKKHGLKQISNYYIMNSHCEKKEYDVVFFGNDKGRREQLKVLRDFLRAEGITCKFVIKRTQSKSRILSMIFASSPYLEVIGTECKGKAILDIVQEGQSSLTLRPYEALYNQIKLITNNKEIMNTDLYDENVFVLGYDDMTKIKEFLNTAYVKNDRYDSAVKQYSFEAWIHRILVTV